MTELRLALSYEALRALVEGDTLEFQAVDDETIIVVRCSEEALERIRDNIHSALMRMLPPAPMVN